MRKAKPEEIFKIPIFKHVTNEILESLIESVYFHEFKKGTQLFSERDMVDKIYIVLEGKVTLYRYTDEGQKKIVYILDEGQLINEVIFNKISASINCEMFEDAKILSIYREELLKIMAMDFDLTCEIINSMSRKIRRLYRQLKNTVPIKIDKKVAAKLWKIGKDYGIEKEDETLINLNLTVTYLADMIGSSRETISRTLKKLESMELIRYENKKMIVKLDGLSKFFKNK